MYENAQKEKMQKSQSTIRKTSYVPPSWFSKTIYKFCSENRHMTDLHGAYIYKLGIGGLPYSNIIKP